MTFKRLSCLLLIVTCFFIAGCDFLTPTELPLETVDFVAANPPSGSTLQPDATITVTFDGVPGNVAVNPGAATLAGQTVTISGPFPAGSLSLVLAWGDGYRRVLNYTVAVEPPPPDDSSGTKPVVPKGMVLIPAGEFQMGSNAPAADDDEQPVHTVSVDAFFMDEHEVTNSNFKAFVRANPDWGKNRSGKANHAVVYVSWYAAVAYSKWVGKRLPTEAEWEYAARGGLSGKAYPWGMSLMPVRRTTAGMLGMLTMRLWAGIRPTGTVCMTWRVMCGSGVWMSTIQISIVLLPVIIR